MKIVAIVVTHQPGLLLLKALNALLAQVSSIVVVDNASSEKDALGILQQVMQEPDVEVIRLLRNMGIGAGHNVGIARARENDASHVLLMDQDSVPRANMVERLLAAEQTLLTAGERVGAVGPLYYDSRLAKYWPFFRMSRFGMIGQRCSGGERIRCDLLISSGTVIRMDVIDTVGLMNEPYFLEHVDTDWSLRASAAGYALFGVCDATMEHHLGEGAIQVPLTRRRVQRYKPYRHYYAFRNSILLSRERHALLPWKLNEIKRLLARLLFLALFVPPRRERLRFMVLGLWHGLKGRAGPLDEYHG